MDGSKEQEANSKDDNEQLKQQIPVEKKVDEPLKSTIDGPLLLEDSTLDGLPKYAEIILSGMETKNATQTDYLALLTYIIALESGFVLKDFDNYESLRPIFWGFSFNISNLNKLTKFPIKFCDRKDSVYIFKLNLLSCLNNDCILLCLRTGDSLCITLSANNLPGRSLCISIARYIPLLNARTLPGKFRNLKELSYLLKDKIFTPVRNSLMEESELNYPGLLGIPTEIVIQILSNLNMRDLIALSKTCKFFHETCFDIMKNTRRYVKLKLFEKLRE